METNSDRPITPEQRPRLARESKKGVRVTVSTLFVTTTVTALSLYLLRFL